MSADALLITSLVLVGVAIVFVASIAIYDKRCSESVKEILLARHGTKGVLSVNARWKIAVFLLYAAIAYSSDISLEWLAAIAFFAFAVALVVDRIISVVMVKLDITPEDPAPKAEARQAAAADGEAVPEPMGEMLINIAGISVTIVAWAAAVSLVMLLGFTFVEVVLPHYIDIFRGLV